MFPEFSLLGTNIVGEVVHIWNLEIFFFSFTPQGNKVKLNWIPFSL